MPQIKNILQLSIREMEVISILWGSEAPLMASEIASMSSRSINTINSVLKKLLDRNLIEVADVVHSHSVLSRRYRPVVSCEDYAIDLFVKQVKSDNKGMSFPSVVSRLLEEGNEIENIIALEKMIAERKQRIQQEKAMCVYKLF